MRLSTRIALAVGLSVPLLVLLCGWLLLQFVSHDLHREQDDHLRERAAAVAKDARTVLRVTAADRPDAVEEARQRQLYSAALDVGVRLVGPGGTFMGGPQPGASVPLPADASSPLTVRDGESSWRVLSVPLRSGKPGAAGARRAATGTLWVFSPDTVGRGQLTLVRRRVITTAVLAAPLSALAAWGIAVGAVRPLGRLRRETSGLDPRASSARLEHRPTGVTEVDELAETMATVLTRYDEQAARTAQALDTARSFSSAASHELRTPLMSMGTNLDILAGHPDLPSQDRAEVLDDLRTEHGRLLGLLVMLRELGRGDLVEKDAFGPVDVAEAADAAVSDARRRAPGARFTLRAGPGLVVHGWEPGIRTLLDNLLANALAHGRSPDGSASVEVGAVRSRDWIVITVDDRGPGIAPDRREAVFGRFHRGPGSTGSGLGLTLVAQQSALHRGGVEISAGPGGVGARFTVRLPAAGDEPRAGQPPLPNGSLPGPRDWLIGAAERSHDSHKNGS